MKQILLQNDGWAAEGYPIRQPRAGWYTHLSDSTFSFMISDTAVESKYVMVYAMKSYSEKWKTSKLAVSTTVVGKNTTHDRDTMSVLKHRAGAVDWDNTDSSRIYYIDGYHNVRSSVHFPHKIPLSGGGAKAGDSIIFDAKLVVGGQAFKIAGVAFCSF